MIDLDEARRISGATTRRPWRFVQVLDGIEARAILDASGYFFGRSDDLENGAFIVFWGTHADSVLAELAALRRLADEVAQEHGGKHMEPECPLCSALVEWRYLKSEPERSSGATGGGG